MRILHHLGLRAGDRERAAFREAGIELPDGARSVGIVGLDMAEDDARWPAAAALCRKLRVVDSVSTEFTSTEMERAQWLGMIARGHHGYPEPSDKGGYLNATFDLANYCRACGAGLKQTAPFRLRKAPAGKRSILQLNWILDEFFVAPDVWQTVFEPLGVGCRLVILHKTGKVMNSAVQLDIPAIRDLALEDRKPEVCTSCSRGKYRYSLRGAYPESADADVVIFKSSQYFGSGGQAFRLVLVANRLYRKIRDADLRGVTFYPTAGSLDGLKDTAAGEGG